MVHKFFFFIFYLKVIDNETEFNGSCVMCPQSWCKLALCVPISGNPFFQELLCQLLLLVSHTCLSKFWHKPTPHLSHLFVTHIGVGHPLGCLLALPGGIHISWVGYSGRSILCPWSQSLPWVWKWCYLGVISWWVSLWLMCLNLWGSLSCLHPQWTLSCLALLCPLHGHIWFFCMWHLRVCL